jgi:MSHA pilin protein MshD
MISALRTTTRSRAPAGFTMIEAVVSTLIVAVLLAASLYATGAAGTTRYKTADGAVGSFLASGLMGEIMTLAYEEPNGVPVFGLDAGELSTSRSNYDDVDDFNGWTESPPADRNGVALPGLSGWQRGVKVEWVLATDPNQVSAVETGAKRITVTVKHGSVPVSAYMAVRTRAP